MGKIIITIIALVFPILLHGQNDIVSDLQEAANKDYKAYINTVALDNVKSICNPVLDTLYISESCDRAIEKIDSILAIGKQYISQENLIEINNYRDHLQNYVTIVNKCIDSFKVADEKIRQSPIYKSFTKKAPEEQRYDSEIRMLAGLIYTEYSNSGLMDINKIPKEYPYLSNKILVMKNTLEELKDVGGKVSPLQHLLRTEEKLSEDHKEFLNIIERK